MYVCIYVCISIYDPRAGQARCVLYVYTYMYIYNVYRYIHIQYIYIYMYVCMYIYRVNPSAATLAHSPPAVSPPPPPVLLAGPPAASLAHSPLAFIHYWHYQNGSVYGKQKEGRGAVLR